MGRSHTLASSASSSLCKPLAARKMQRTALSDLSNKQPNAAAPARQDRDELGKKRAAVTARAHSIQSKQPTQPSIAAATATLSSVSVSTSSSRVIRPIAVVGSAASLPASLSFSSGTTRSIVRPVLPSSASFSLPASDWSAMGMKRKAADDDDGEDDEDAKEDEDDDINNHIDGQRAHSQPAAACMETSKQHAADMLISPTAALATSLSNLATSASAAAIPPSSNACRPSHAHLYVTDYASHILGHMLSSQATMLPSSSYMAQQADLNPKMREILVDWLTEVSHKFRLQEETMLLSVSIVDRFLSVQPVGRRRLQLVGCVGMLLACKYEEMLVPEVDDFVHVSDKAYTRDDLIECEATVLNALSFRLTAPSPLRFLDTLYAREVMDGQEKHESDVEAALRERVRLQSLYLLNISLQHYRFLAFRPALLALSAFALSSASIRSASHPAHIALLALCPPLYGCTDAELLDCEQQLYDAWLSMALAEGAEQQGVVGARYRAVERKFTRDKYCGVNRLPLLRPTAWCG